MKYDLNDTITFSTSPESKDNTVCTDMSEPVSKLRVVGAIPVSGLSVLQINTLVSALFESSDTLDLSLFTNVQFKQTPKPFDWNEEKCVFITPITKGKHTYPYSVTVPVYSIGQE